MEKVREELETVVKGSYDIIVVGAGVAGVAAAVAARRLGVEKVLLIERSITLGGLSTAGLIGWYEPLDDGKGNRLSYGISEELFRLAVKYSHTSLAPAWRSFPSSGPAKPRCSGFFSPGIFSLALDQFLRDNDVDVLLDSLVVRSLMDGRLCRGVVVENKGGRFAYLASTVIDASGDADVMARSGVPCVTGKNWLTYIAYRADRGTMQRSLEKGSTAPLSSWVNSGADLYGKGHPEGFPCVSGTSAEEVTLFVREGRKRMLDMIASDTPDSRDLVSVPSMAQLRETRHIVGLSTFTALDEGFCDSSITACGDFTAPGKSYEVPFGTLFNPAFGNLLAAGRIISTSGWGWDVTRVIPVAVSTGQAAGTAAALSLLQGCLVPDLPLSVLQSSLERQGVRLHR